MRRSCLAAILPFQLIACNGEAGQVASNTNGTAATAPARSMDGKLFTATPVGQFDEPWAMTFLPDSPMLLITEKVGTMKFVDTNTGRLGTVTGLPDVDYGGQGGLGDVVLHPDFTGNRLIYLSWAEAGEGDTRGAAVGRGRLICEEADACRIEGLSVIWRQQPKVTGRGHYGHRIAFGPDGLMYISSGDRQKFDPAQDMNANLGKILRLNDDGTPATGNPWTGGAVTSQIWSMGHRNPLGIAFAPDGTLWEHEMGPKGGDEFNRIERGSNYGYPIVSNGDHYDGRDIPDHSTRPEFNAPEITWTPVISPAGLIFYSGLMFPEWRGNALLGGLSGKALLRIAIDGPSARVADRWDMGARIREIEQGPDGAVWLLEDEDDGSGGRLLKLTPAG